MKLILKGKETIKGKLYKNPDILHSKIDGITYTTNKLTINKSKGFYIYHSYDKSTEYSGRWYDTNFNSNNIIKNDNKNKITFKLFNIFWNDLSNQNIDIEIFFTPSGYNKIKKNL